MGKTIKTPNARELADFVRKQLERRLASEGSLRIHVDADSVHRTGSCWYVPVWPETEVPIRYHYYDILADVEMEAQDAFGTEIVLLPSSPSSNR